MEYSLSKLPVSQQQLLLPLLKLKQDVGRDNCAMLCDLFENFAKATQNFSSALKVLQHKADAFHKIAAAGTVHPDVSQALVLIRGEQHKSDTQEFNTAIVASTTAEQSGLLTVWSGIGVLFGSMHREFEKLNNTISNDVLNPLQTLLKSSGFDKNDSENDLIGGVANFIPNLQIMAANGKYTNSKVQKGINHVLKSHEFLQDCILEENAIVQRVKVALKNNGIETDGMDNVKIKELASSRLDSKSKTALYSAIRHTMKAKENLGKHLQELFALVPELRQLAKSSESSDDSTIISLDQIGYQVSNAQNCPSDVAANLVNEFINWEMNRLGTISRALQTWIKIHVECEQKNYSPLVKVWGSLSEDFSPLGDFNSFVKNLMGPRVKSIQTHAREHNFEDVKLLGKLPEALDSIDNYSLCEDKDSYSKKISDLYLASTSKNSVSATDFSTSSTSRDSQFVTARSSVSSVFAVGVANPNENLTTSRILANSVTGRSDVTENFVTARTLATTSRSYIQLDKVQESDELFGSVTSTDVTADPALKLPLHKLNELSVNPNVEMACNSKIDKIGESDNEGSEPSVENVPTSQPTFRDFVCAESGTFSTSLIASNLSELSKTLATSEQDKCFYNPIDKPDVREVKSISHVPLPEYYFATDKFTGVDQLLIDKQNRLVDYFENLLNTSLYTNDAKDVDKWSDWRSDYALPPTSVLQRHDLYPVCIDTYKNTASGIKGDKMKNKIFGIQLNDIFMDSEQWDIATFETIILVHRFLNSYISHPLLHQRFDSKSIDDFDTELQIYLLANVGLFEHCAGAVLQLIELIRDKKVTSPITNSLVNSLVCSRDSFQSNIFEEGGFSIHPLDVRYRVALLLDSWNKDDIRIENINQSIYDFPDFYKWCYRQLHFVHLTIAFKLWRLVRYSPKFGPSIVENWESIITGGDNVGNFTELFEVDNGRDTEFFSLARYISSLLLKAIRSVSNLKVMYTERLNSSKNDSSQIGKSELLKLLETMSKIAEAVERNESFTSSGPSSFVNVIQGDKIVEKNVSEKNNVNYSFACDMQVYADENLSLLHEWGFIQTDIGCMASCFCRNGIGIEKSNDGKIHRRGERKKASGINHLKYKMGSDKPKCKYFVEPFESVKLSQFWCLEEPILINLLSRCYSVVPIDGIGSESASLSADSPQVIQGILIASTALQIGVSPNLFVLNSVNSKGVKMATRPETQIPLIPMYMHSILLYYHIFNSIKKTKSTCWNSPRVLISLHVSVNAFDKLISLPKLLPIEVYAANSDSAIQSHEKYLEMSHLSSVKAYQFITNSLLKGLHLGESYASDCNNKLDTGDISVFRASRYEKNCLALFALRSFLGDEYDNCFGTSILYLDPFFIKAEHNCRNKLFRGIRVLSDKLPVNKSILRRAIHNLVDVNLMLDVESNEFLKSGLTMGEKFEKMSKIVTSLFEKARRFERMYRDYIEFSNFRIDFYESLSIVLMPHLEKLISDWKDNEILPCTDKLFRSFETVLTTSSSYEDVVEIKEAIIGQFTALFKDKFLVGLTRRLDSVINMVSQTVAKDDFKPISADKHIYYSCWVSDLVSLLRHTISICFKFSAPVEWLISPLFEMGEKVIDKYSRELNCILKVENVLENGNKIKSSAKAIADILEFEDFSDHLLDSEKLDIAHMINIDFYIVSLHNLMLITSEMEMFELDERVKSPKTIALINAGRKRMNKKSQTAISNLENAIAWRILLELVPLGGCDKLSVIRREFGLSCDRLLDSLPEESQKSIYNKAHDALVLYISYIVKRDLERGHLAEIAKDYTPILLSSINDLCMQTCKCGVGNTASAQSQFANLITFLTIALNTDTPICSERKKHPKLAKLGLKVRKKCEAIIGSGRQT